MAMPRWGLCSKLGRNFLCKSWPFATETEKCQNMVGESSIDLRKLWGTPHRLCLISSFSAFFTDQIQNCGKGSLLRRCRSGIGGCCCRRWWKRIRSVCASSEMALSASHVDNVSWTVINWCLISLQRITVEILIVFPCGGVMSPQDFHNFKCLCLCPICYSGVDTQR